MYSSVQGFGEYSHIYVYINVNNNIYKLFIICDYLPLTLFFLSLPFVILLELTCDSFLGHDPPGENHCCRLCFFSCTSLCGFLLGEVIIWSSQVRWHWERDWENCLVRIGHCNRYLFVWLHACVFVCKRTCMGWLSSRDPWILHDRAFITSGSGV